MGVGDDLTGTTTDGDNNLWVTHGQNHCWALLHKSKRRSLETPCGISNGPAIGSLSALRFTCGTYDNGKIFTHFDSWKSNISAHAELQRPWTGTTIFFDRACANPDEIMESISALHNDGQHASKRVPFSIADPDVHEVQPHSEIYGSHPHFSLAGKNN